jgi:hypothetical protein
VTARRRAARGHWHQPLFSECTERPSSPPIPKAKPVDRHLLECAALCRPVARFRARNGPIGPPGLRHGLWGRQAAPQARIPADCTLLPATTSPTVQGP